MKTQEEIEKMANEFSKDYIKTTNNSILQSSFKLEVGYIKGYKQCQEDMAKDVEYWQGEFEHWYKQAMDMSNKYNELLNKQDQKNWIKEL